MAGFAQVAISGNVQKDSIGFKTVGAQDTPLLTFTVRWSYWVGKGKGYMNKGYDSAFLDVEVWGKYAETLATQLQDDMNVSLIGALAQNNWTNKEGQKRSKMLMKANSVFLGGQPGELAAAQAEQDDLF